MARLCGWVAAVLLLLGTMPATAQRKAETRPLPAYLTSPVLETFSSESVRRLNLSKPLKP